MSGVPLIRRAAVAVLLVCGLTTPWVTAAPAAASGASGAAGDRVTAFEPSTLTATSDRDWWVLGTARCDGAKCLAIMRTADAGKSFTALPTPWSPTAGGPVVGELLFANARDGYAFGPGLWSTHDGGHSWRELRIGAGEDVAAADGYVYALVSNSGSSELLRSPVSHDAWRVLHTPAAPTPLSGLGARGRTVLVQGRGRVMVSHDGGAHFSYGGRLPVGAFCGFDQTADSSVMWAYCNRAVAGGEGPVIRSSNSGASWTRLAGGGTIDGPPQTFAAASASVAVLAGYQRLYRTTNGGGAWSPVAGLPAAFSAVDLAFSDATHGVAIGGVGSGRRFRLVLYATDDGGASYRRVKID